LLIGSEIHSRQHHRQGNLLECGDKVHVRAHKGFLIYNELAAIGATLKIPVSLKKKKCSFQKKQRKKKVPTVHVA